VTVPVTTPVIAADIIAALDLAPHPEGGWYRQTWAAPAAPGQRPGGSAIYFLLRAAEVSHWHRFDAAEIWHHHTGAALTLRMAATAQGPVQTVLLGPDIARGMVPQAVVPQGWWQSARSAGEWTLVGCTTTPAFQFDGFELAPPGFDIPD